MFQSPSLLSLPLPALPQSAGTLYLLLDLMSFFDLYRLRRTDEALEVLRRLRLVPLQQAELELRLAEFGRLQEEVRGRKGWSS